MTKDEFEKLSREIEDMCNKYTQANNILESIEEIKQLNEYPWIKAVTIIVRSSKSCDGSDVRSFHIDMEDDELQNVILSTLDAYAYRQERRFERLNHENDNDEPVHRP